MTAKATKKLSSKEQEKILEILGERFIKNLERHKSL